MKKMLFMILKKNKMKKNSHWLTWLSCWVLMLPGQILFAQTDCLPPVSLTASGITHTTAELSWTSTGTIFDIEWGISGFIQGDGNLVTGISGTSYTLTGLTESTDYHYYARQDCSTDEESDIWAGPFSFTTKNKGQIGEGMTTANLLPINACHIYSYSQQIYLADEIEEALDAGEVYITKIRFKIGNLSTFLYYLDYFNDWTVYLGNTTQSAFVDTADWVPYANLQQVFSGNIFNTEDWVEITLDTPFLWNGISNIVVGVNKNSSQGTICNISWGSFNSGSNRGLLYYSSLNNPNLASPPTALFGPSATIAQIQFEAIELPTCFQPTEISSTNATAYSVDLSWNSPGDLFDIQYGENGFTLGNGTLAEDVTTTSYTLTGLIPQTSYEYYVRQNCGQQDGESIWSGPFGFTTLCVPVSEMDEDFDSITAGEDALPDCWTKIGSGSNAAHISSAQPYSGPNSIYMYRGILSQNILITPYLDNLADQTHWLRFKARRINPLTLTVGYMTDVTDTGTFVELETFTLDTAYPGDNFFVYPLNLPETAKHLAFRNNTYLGTIYIDDVVWEVAPTCIPPASLTATNFTQTTAELSWSSDGTLFDIEYGPFGFTPGTGTTITGVPNPYTVTGLNSATSYQYYVRRDCGEGDLSSWGGSFGFTTLCDAVTFITENFDSYGTGEIVPDCWDRIISGTSASQTIVATTPASGIRNIRQQSNDPANATIVVLPPVNNINASTHWLRFKARVGLGTGHLQVGYVTDISDESTFVEVLPLTITNTVYTTEDAEYVVPFPESTPSNARIAIRNPGTSNIIAHFWDDVYWEEAPTCVYPLGLSAANNSQSSTVLSWLSNGALFDIEYGPTGFTLSDGTIISGVGNPYTLTGLTPDTTYEYYVRQDCGDDDGVTNWAGPFEFTTGAYTGNIPTMLNANPGVEDDVCSTTPFSIEVPEGHQLASLNVQYTMISYNAAWISQQRSVLYSPTLNAGETDVVAGEEDYPGSITYNRDVDFANGATGTVEFVLKAWRTANGAGCSTDHVYVMDGSWILTFETELIPTCPNPPTGLGYTNITEDSVDLIWENEEGTLFEVRWGTVGFDPEDEEGALISGITTTSYTLSGLDSSIAYEFYVRRDCSAGDEEDYGDWAGPFKFNSGYCLPTSQLTQYISAFSTGLALENISYTSTAINPGGYGNKTDLVVSREPGESFTFSTNFIGGQNAVRIWVDWNHNFLFEEDEEVFSGSNPGPGNLVTGSIAIPAGVVPGNYVMRVRTVYGASASPQPCGEVQYGEALDFTLHIACVIAAPAGETAQVFTQGQTLADLDITGVGLVWYADSELTDVLNETHELVHGVTYYVVSSNEYCQSEASAITVTDICFDFAAPAGEANQTFTPGQTLANLEVTGTGFIWYAEETLDTVLENSTELVHEATYYVISTNDNCVSEALAITVADVCFDFSAPAGEANQTFTPGQTLANLEVTGIGLTWYAEENLTIVLEETEELVHEATYYVISTNDNCISEALAVTVTDICFGFAAPAGETNQTFTPGQTLADLDVEGTGLTWYAEETLSTVLENSTELVHGVTYYVVSSDDDCQSAVLAITVTEEVSTASFDRYAFKYYPNPVNDVLYFSSDTPISDVTVINMLGQKLNVLVQSDNTRVDMTGLPSGNYFISITIEGINKAFKVIKH